MGGGGGGGGGGVLKGTPRWNVKQYGSHRAVITVRTDNSLQLIIDKYSEM